MNELPQYLTGIGGAKPINLHTMCIVVTKCIDVLAGFGIMTNQNKKANLGLLAAKPEVFSKRA